MKQERGFIYSMESIGKIGKTKIGIISLGYLIDIASKI